MCGIYVLSNAGFICVSCFGSSLCAYIDDFILSCKCVPTYVFEICILIEQLDQWCTIPRALGSVLCMGSFLSLVVLRFLCKVTIHLLRKYSNETSDFYKRIKIFISDLLQGTYVFFSAFKVTFILRMIFFKEVTRNDLNRSQANDTQKL